MRCPSCNYLSPFETVRCPDCETTFEAQRLEELTHLRYLRDRIEGWRAERVLTARTAKRMLGETKVELRAVEEALGLRAPGHDRPAIPAPLTVAPVEAAAAGAPAAVGAPVTVAPPVAAEPPVGAEPPPGPPLAEAPPRPAFASARPPAPAPSRPSFSWADVGTYLLSEKTLHALLGLGAFLILASGVVISTLNPTRLGPFLHLTAVVATTALFYAAGYVVRQRLKLGLTGSALLAIGGAFVPLSIWTLGQERLLDWQPDAIWLATSMLCLPLYLASHAALRDRTFGVLTAVAGGSELLAIANWLRVPLEWGLCAVLLLALGYVLLAKRLRAGWETLAWALFWTAQVAAPTIMALLMVTKIFPIVYEASTGRALGGLYEYAIGGAWWLGTAFYVVCARLFERRRYAFAAAWTLPFAYLFTLTKAPWDAAWYNLCLALLAGLYLAYAYRRQWPPAVRARTALEDLLLQPASQVGLALTVVAAAWPFQSADSRIPTLYATAGVYALAASLFGLRELRYAAAYLLPLPFALSLDRLAELGFAWTAPGWHNVALAALATGYLLVGRFGGPLRWSPERAPGYRELAREPVFQVALLLTLAAAAWPRASRAGEVATLFVLAAGYAGAAHLLRQRAWAYVGTYLVPIAYALLTLELDLAAEMQPLAWAGLAAVLLAGGENAAARSGEGRRPLFETIVGRGSWSSRFASPSFSAAYAASLVGLGLGVAQYWTAPAAAGVRYVGVPVILGLLGVVLIYTLSAIGRRTSFFLYLSAWVFLIPFMAGARLVYREFGLPLLEHDLARLLAGLGVGYLALAFTLDRVGGHYSKPVHLAGYALLPWAMLLSALDRATNVQVIGLSILVYAGSAWLVHRERHTAYLWLVRRLFRDGASAAHLAARSAFLYLACWLFPVWLTLAMSLRQPALEVAHYGLALALLASVYAAIGRLIRRVRPEYRLPWYLAGFALSALGPLVATPDQTLRAVALAISIGLYVASTVVSRSSAWLYPVALLTPVLLWQSLERLALFDRFYGLGLVVLGLAYGGLGLLLHHGSWRRLGQPVTGPIGAYGLPFLATGYALGALGLARVINQERGLVVIGFLLGALHQAGSALAFRQRLFGYPMVAALGVAYVVGMWMTPLDGRFHGLGLLPGMAAALALAELLRRRVDAPAAHWTRVAGRWLDTWSAPFYAAIYLGTLAVPLASTAEQGIWAAAWWSVSAVYLVSTALFRHPSWLYPTVGPALMAYAATAYAVRPELPLADLMAALVAPTWALFWLAHTIVRRPARAGLGALQLLEPPQGLASPWAAPLVAYGWLLLVVSTIGTIPEARTGLMTALAYTALLVAFALLWQGLFEVWAGLAIGALAFQQALRVLEVPLLDQPPRWALVALLLTLAAIGLRRREVRHLALWTRPLYLSSIGIGGAAMLVAATLQVLQPQQFEHSALQGLAATSAITGLTLVAHGFDRRERILGYQGVALIEVGYMLQLVFFDVGQPQAFVLPAGLYLLAVAYLEWRRGSPAIVKRVLEGSGLALLLSTSLVQAVGFLGAGHDRYLYDTFLLVESVALFGLGAVLHWRNSFFAGALALIADVAILLADPLRAMNTWYLVAMIGVAMIGLVILVERQRQRIPFWLEEWRQRLETWD